MLLFLISFKMGGELAQILLLMNFLSHDFIEVFYLILIPSYGVSFPFMFFDFLLFSFDYYSDSDSVICSITMGEMLKVCLGLRRIVERGRRGEELMPL